MENKKMLGVTLYHLKDKFAYGSVSGNEMSEFKFSEEQIAALFEYLHRGVFEGMFEANSLEDYQDIMGLNYASLAREEGLRERRRELKETFYKDAQDLEEFHNQYLSENGNSQPE